MGKITLITGGSRSGKSTFAEKILEKEDDVLYIATAVVTDSEMEKRIEKHKLRRNQKWETYEGFTKLDQAIKKSSRKYIMLECIGTMVTNIIFEKNYDFDNITSDDIEKLEKDIIKEVDNIISSVKHSDKHILIVTNEVGYSVVSEYKLSRIFVDILGRVNQFIARVSDEVYMVACGLPIKLK